MSDMNITDEKMKTFDGHEKISFFKAGEKLMEFGEKQNTANETLALNVNDLIKRISTLEEKQLKNEEIMHKVATEIAAAKKELDRIRLSDKLNTSAIARLDKALSMVSEQEQETRTETETKKENEE